MMHNEDSTVNAFSPVIGFGARSTSGGYNSMYAGIMGKKTGNGPDSNWNSGELHFFTASSSYMDNNPTFAITPSNLFYTGNIILHAGNYSSYALPLSGGTLTGDLILNSAWGSGAYNEQLVIYGTYPSWTTRSTTSDTGWLFHTDGSGEWTLYSIAGATTNNWTQRYTFNRDGTFRNGGPSGSVYLHAGNYTSYAPSIGGGSQISGGNNSYYTFGPNSTWAGSLVVGRDHR